MMTKKNIYRLLAILMALVVAGIFMLCDLGLEMTPLTKFFVIFFGAIIGLQSAPAALLFVGMIKGVSTRGQESTEQSLSSNGVIHLNARKILIADKDNAARQQLADFFKDSDYEVETTASAAYAIAKIVQKKEPIVILGDSFEEKITSADVIALMRKSNKNLRIILISDDSSLETLSSLREDGIFYHAFKPHNQADNEELRSAVKCAVEGFQPAMS
ncbi:MAG: response regulator [Desulfuromusa sp.]